MAENNQYIQGNETIALNKINQSHERAVQKEDHSHEEEMQKLANERAEKEQSKDLGLVGRLFGGDKNSSKNITAIINIILLIGATAVSLVVYFCEQDKAFVKAIWTGVLPVVTLSLGYLFGKK